MNVTHEPQNALPGFPYSHVKVDDVFYENCAECVKLTIHGDEHYLHQTTAFALYKQLQNYFKELNEVQKMLLILNGSELGDELFESTE